MEPSRPLVVFSDMTDGHSHSKQVTTRMEPETWTMGNPPDMDEKGSVQEGSIVPESNSQTQVPLNSKPNGEYATRGSRSIQFYHFSDYTLDYTQIFSHLSSLSRCEIKGTAAVMDVVRDLVRTGLRHPTASIDNLEWFTENLKYGELEDFLYKQLPKIAMWALEAEMFFPESSKLLVLEQETQRELTFSRFQVLCLMSLSFFGLFPDTTSPELSQHRHICGLFYRSKHDNAIKREKLKLVFEYFKQMSAFDEAKLVDPCITYSRRGLNSDKVSKVEFWSSQPGDLSEVEFNHTDNIESYDEALQVDFANK